MNAIASRRSVRKRKRRAAGGAMSPWGYETPVGVAESTAMGTSRRGRRRPLPASGLGLAETSALEYCLLPLRDVVERFDRVLRPGQRGVDVAGLDLEQFRVLR